MDNNENKEFKKPIGSETKRHLQSLLTQLKSSPKTQSFLSMKPTKPAEEAKTYTTTLFSGKLSENKSNPLGSMANVSPPKPSPGIIGASASKFSTGTTGLGAPKPVPGMNIVMHKPKIVLSEDEEAKLKMFKGLK